MSLFACTSLPSKPHFLTNFGYPLPPCPVDVIFEWLVYRNVYKEFKEQITLSVPSDL